MTTALSLMPFARDLASPGDLIDEFFHHWDLAIPSDITGEWIPAFDIMENEKEYVVEAELPGIDVKDLEVTISDGLLTVKGEKKREREHKDENFYRVERSFGSFHRSFRIPDKIQTDKIDATYKNGILRLTLPKAEVPEVKKIKVK